MSVGQMTPELARKVAVCLRKYASLESENKKLTSDRDNQKTQSDTFRKEAEACRAVLDGIREGVIDPDDYEEKIAELKEVSQTSVKTASPTGQAPAQNVGIGRVFEKVASAEGEMDPLTEFLFQMEN